MEVKSEQEMIDLGHQFAGVLTKIIDSGLLASTSDMGENTAEEPVGAIAIELIGDVGVGKTTFTRGLAKGFGVKEPITSPSFTISKAYALPNGGRFIHYDFYRLSSPGLMADDLAENLLDPRNIIVIEWGESVSGLLPERHIKLGLAYTDDGRKLIL